MTFNIYNQNNKKVGQIETETITDAWDGARKMFQTKDTIVLDVRRQCQWCDHDAKWHHEDLFLCESCAAEFLGLPPGQPVEW